MTDENTPAEPQGDAAPQDQAPAQEPAPQVSLAEAVEEGIKAAPKKAAEIEQTLSQQLTPEQLKQVETLAESKASRAVNEALESERKKAETQLANALTPEDVQQQVNEAIALERKVGEAQRQLDVTLGQLGAPVGTEEYQKVEAFISQGLESGAITHNALFNEDIVKGLVAAAGVGTSEPAETQSYPSPGLHGAPLERSTDDTAVNSWNVKQVMEQRMEEALRNQG